MLLEESTAQMQDETDLGESVLAGVAKDSRDARHDSRPGTAERTLQARRYLHRSGPQVG